MHEKSRTLIQIFFPCEQYSLFKNTYNTAQYISNFVNVCNFICLIYRKCVDRKEMKYVIYFSLYVLDSLV